jgi:hypothetical protein
VYKVHRVHRVHKVGVEGAAEERRVRGEALRLARVPPAAATKVAAEAG